MKQINRNAWNAFLDNVEQAQDELGRPEIVWFRGHSNSEWPLLPSLIRTSNDLKLNRDQLFHREQFLFREYSRSSHRFHEQRDSDWKLLADMQHYGIPTRLLDWTEVLGIAVAFATLRQFSQPKDAAVFILDPALLNEQSRSKEVVHIPDKDFEYQAVYWRNMPIKAIHPIAIDIPFQNTRILAQRGAFTIHGSNIVPLEDQCPTAVKKVILPVTALDAARDFLRHANLNEYSIYPDIFGMAQHIVSMAFGNGRLR